MNNILEIKKLNFSYKYQRNIGAFGFRDLFVQAIKNPLNYFAPHEEVPVLKNINLSLKTGDRLAISGVNGSGKTTLCRLILGIIQPPKGTIITNGTMRGVLTASGLIFPELTGRENASLLMEILYPELSKSDKKELMNECLDFSELGYYLDVPYQSYSKGMQNRLFLSIISGRPADLMILDEVFDGADVGFQKKFEVRILKMLEKCKALIFVSHSEDNIKKVCNKRAHLENGQLVFHE
jgi:ABC-type polysaccharide/polyol phosphate transport system ATPase subunit